MAPLATPAPACAPLGNGLSQPLVSAREALLETLVQPRTGLRRAVEERRWWLPLALATACSLALAGTASVRMDWRTDVAAGLERGPGGPGGGMTPQQREEAIATGRNVAIVGTIASGAFGPA